MYLQTLAMLRHHLGPNVWLFALEVVEKLDDFIMLHLVVDFGELGSSVTLSTNKDLQSGLNL